MKTALFFLLMIAATALLVLGANLWAQTQAQMDAVEKQFTTLGMVEQKPNRTQMRTGWDAADGAYYSEAEPVYDSVISADVLDFDGANYLKAPEKRPYYLADLQGLAVRDGGTALFYLVVEFTPAETAVPDHPIKVYVQRFLYRKRKIRTTNTKFTFATTGRKIPRHWRQGKHMWRIQM